MLPHPSRTTKKVRRRILFVWRRPREKNEQGDKRKRPKGGVTDTRISAQARETLSLTDGSSLILPRKLRREGMRGCSEGGKDTCY